MKTEPFEQRLEDVLAHRPWLGALVLAGSLLAAYANSFSVPFHFDDISSILDNPTIRGFWSGFSPPSDHGYTVAGRPVLNFTFALNWLVGGDHVVGYHVANFLIHLGSTLLLNALVVRILALPLAPVDFGPRRRLIGFSVAALWSLHPLQTESVTYIVQRAESLAALFYLLALYTFIRSVDGMRRSMAWQALCLLSIFVGFGVKETIVSVPLVILLCDRGFAAGSFTRAIFQRKRFYLCLFFVWATALSLVLALNGRADTAGFSSGVSGWLYLCTQAHALCVYIGRAFVPVGLTFDYGRWVAADLASVGWEFTGMVGAVLWSLYLLVKKPRTAVLVVTFFALLAPTTLIPIATQTIAEHRIYLALGTIIIGSVLAAKRLSSQWGLAGCAFVAVAFLPLTLMRNNDYTSVEKLWRDTVVKRPDNPRAWGNIALLQQERGELEAAKRTYLHALELPGVALQMRIDFSRLLSQLGELDLACEYLRSVIQQLPEDYTDLFNLRYELALLHMRKTESTQALELLRLAAAQRPSEQKVREAAAGVLVVLGRKDEAAAEYAQVVSASPRDIARRIKAAEFLQLNKMSERAVALLAEGLALDAGSAELRLAFSRALLEAGDPQRSVVELERCLRQRPDWDEAHLRLGLAWLAMQDGVRAVQHFAAAEKAGSKTAALQAGWGRACLGLGDVSGALLHFTRALEMDPTDTQTRYLLANVLLDQGRPADAIPHYEKVVADSPDMADAGNELGVAYTEAGRLEDARRAFTQVLGRHPQHEQARENLRQLQP